ncbi:MAG TPA: hypothetical protein VNR18_00750 [Hyphomicrobiales bacterium]|nr:hypothetical protein [Hyphomicrobiales bacterium]
MRWWLSLLVSLFVLSRPGAPLGVWLVFGGMAALAIWNLGGAKLARLVRMKRRAKRRKVVA